MHVVTGMVPKIRSAVNILGNENLSTCGIISSNVDGVTDTFLLCHIVSHILNSLSKKLTSGKSSSYF